MASGLIGLILDLTTNVDLYIAKVFQTGFSQDRKPIIDALSHARKEWKVDMISLSFGFRIPTYPDSVQDEIKACIESKIVVFGSASNDGG
jgi:hypothetical protein